MSTEILANESLCQKNQLDCTTRRIQSGSSIAQPKTPQKPSQEDSWPNVASEAEAAATTDAVPNRPCGSLEESDAAIKEFLEDYPKEKPIYDQLASLTEKICKDALRVNLGTKFLTMSRGKDMGIPVGRSMGTLEKSIRRRLDERLRWEPSEKGYYKDKEDIRHTMHDLAGARIILAFPDDDVIVNKFITTSFKYEKNAQYRGVDQDGKVKVKELAWGDLTNRFIGYRATHYVVSLNAKQAGQELLKKQVEIQVTSMTMYAWQEVNHDLNYKVSEKIGELMPDEKRTLDMVNGLVHANEVALNQFHASLKRRVLIMDTEFFSFYDLRAWLEEYTFRRWKVKSYSAFFTDPLAPGFESLLLQTLCLTDYNNPRKLRALLEEPMPEVSKEPLITIRKAVTNFEDNYVKGYWADQWSMWPVLKICVKHSWLRDAVGDEELDQKIFFLLNYKVLSRVFDVTSSSWTSNILLGGYARDLTPDSGELFLGERDLINQIDIWTHSRPPPLPAKYESSVSAPEMICPVPYHICPAEVETSWTFFWTHSWNTNEEHLAKNDLERYLLWFKGDMESLTTSLALLGITADSTSSYTEYGHDPGETEWHWPIHAMENTALAAFPYYNGRTGKVCTTFVQDKEHWRKVAIREIEMRFLRSKPPKELRRILLDFRSLDKGTLGWVHGHKERMG